VKSTDLPRYRQRGYAGYLFAIRLAAVIFPP
jgi:hypothetical protein